MTEHTTEIGDPTSAPLGRDAGAPEALALVVAWSAAEPGRAGELVLLPRGDRAARILGRGDGDGTEPRATLVRQVPGANLPTGGLTAPRLSRRQLRLQRLRAGKVLVERVGRCALRVRGERVDQAVIGPGDRVEIEGQLLLLCTTRPERLDSAHHWPTEAHPIGAADRCGLVGESPALWHLRDQVAFVAAHAGHVLVLGPSGAGKELVARAIHHLSPRTRCPLVARNAATIPATLIDAELFGNARHYPNHGMAERPGLVGEADGSTLFLDELGELPEALQAHLLRLMDHGEYQRLGEARARRADLRLVGATNRPRSSLKDDLGARFRHVVTVPPLDQRREDVPLLAAHLLREACAGDPALAARFLRPEDGQPRMDLPLVEALLIHPLPLQVRQLDGLLWQCVAQSRGDRVLLAPGIVEALPAPEAAPPAVDPAELSAAEVRGALEAHDWVQERVWRELGLGSRYVLRRLMRKYDLRAPEGRG